jgi:uncharacterized protein YaeQ
VNNDNLLHSQQTNHGQSEIWLESEGLALTPRRKLPTNESLNVALYHCADDAFKAFYEQYHRSVDSLASLSLKGLEVIAEELRLKV